MKIQRQIHISQWQNSIQMKNVVEYIWHVCNTAYILRILIVGTWKAVHKIALSSSSLGGGAAAGRALPPPPPPWWHQWWCLFQCLDQSGGETEPADRRHPILNPIAQLASLVADLIRFKVWTFLFHHLPISAVEEFHKEALPPVQKNFSVHLSKKDSFHKFFFSLFTSQKRFI